MSMTEFTVKEVTVLRVATFLNEALCNFLGIYEIFNITHSARLDCQMWFQKGISFVYSNFDNNIPFSVHMKFFKAIMLDSN